MIKFHFLNVGHGDTTIIELPDDELMLVDFNRDIEFDDETAKELAEIYKIDFNKLEKSKKYYSEISKYYNILLDDSLTYLKENFEDKNIFRYIQTHPDIDHLAGFKALTENFSIVDFWDTDHENIEKTDFKNDSDEEDWKHYLEFRKNKKKIYYRSSNKISSNDQTYPYKIYVFHPTREALVDGDSKENPQPNFFSYLILIDYNGFKTVLGGDVTEKYWKDLWEWLEDNESAKQLFKDIHVLKASHHGRKSGRCGWEEKKIYKRDFLNWMNPENVIISVGKKPENCDATEWYRKKSDGSSRNVLTTRWYGTVWSSYDGTTPFDKEKIKIETRYDRKDSEDHIKQLAIPIKESGYTFKIGAQRCALKSGPFREEYKKGGRALTKNMWLKFYVKKTDIPEPFEVKWRVVNTGEEARLAEDLRGRIEDDKGFKAKREQTKYKGTHFMDCFAIKDGVCVAKDRFYVNIK
ncbi:MAG TPA: nucleotide-binding domain-containing protein [Candidatus Brocadiia bacterium]|nr:hypothetical protein [Candidatus Brocadiales bacterium]